MKAVVLTRLLILCFVSIALSACTQSDDSSKDRPASVASITPENSGKEAMPVHEEQEPPRTFGELHTGETTFYRATGKGNCSFGKTDDLMVAAINTKDYADAGMCGAYIEVSGPKGKVTVRVVDRCPGCKQGGIDLSREAFAEIADPAAGRVPVSWQIVTGPVTGPIAYFYMDGTTRYWTAIQLRNHKWPVSTLEILPKGTTDWIPVERRRYNYFVHPKVIPAGPLRVRVTSVTGDMLEDELPEPSGGLLIEGSLQFQ